MKGLHTAEYLNCLLIICLARRRKVIYCKATNFLWRKKRDKYQVCFHTFLVHWTILNGIFAFFACNGFFCVPWVRKYRFRSFWNLVIFSQFSKYEWRSISLNFGWKENRYQLQLTMFSNDQFWHVLITTTMKFNFRVFQQHQFSFGKKKDLLWLFLHKLLQYFVHFVNMVESQ